MKLKDVEFNRIAKALADPQRREILEKLAATRELCGAELVEQFEVSQPTICHHMKELAGAGLVERRKDGQFVYYSFQSEVMAAYLAELQQRLGLPASPERTPSKAR